MDDTGDKKAQLKVLIIDDDEGFRTMMEEMLLAEGYDVYSAENGRYGLDLVNEITIDLVITDIAMPLVNGIEVTLELIKHHPKIKIIAISGDTPDFYLTSAITFGAHDSLRKPFALKELSTRIRRLLNLNEL